MGKGDQQVDTNTAPYWTSILDDIQARSTWNKMDDEIMKRRSMERSRKRPYPGAPNPVVPIIDETCDKKTDQEISMILNSPRVAHFIPIGDTTQETALKAGKAFDTFLRHVIRFRPQKEEGVDMKNERGFSISKVVMKDDIRFGVIPTFITVDCKDCIVPSDTKVPVSENAERITYVLRFSERDLIERKDEKGWSNVDELIEMFGQKRAAESEERPVTGTISSYDDDNTLEVKEKMMGISASDYKLDNYVIWEVFHYATQWDVDQDKANREEDDPRISVGDRCVSYISPDFPGFALKVMPWKFEAVTREMTQEEEQNEILDALKENRDPVFREIEIEPERERLWESIQHRYSYRDQFWYNSWGIGRKVLDNQITATAMKKKKLIWADFATNPMFKQTGDSNQQTAKIAPGGFLPNGLDFAQMPVPPSTFDFDIDSEKRDAANRVGAGDSIFSGNVTESRSLNKTATEVRAETANRGLVTSASADRFNEPDHELYSMLWAHLKRLKVKLPIIENTQFVGFADDEIYEGEYIITPASSAKTLDPDTQFLKSKEALALALELKDLVPVNVLEGLSMVLNQHDPDFAQVVLGDPNAEGPNGQPPIYTMLQQIQETMTQFAEELQRNNQEDEAIAKLAVENSEEIEKIKVQDEQERISNQNREPSN